MRVLLKEVVELVRAESSARSSATEELQRSWCGGHWIEKGGEKSGRKWTPGSTKQVVVVLVTGSKLYGV